LKKIKVGAVGYLNTRPLLFGMQSAEFLRENELVSDYPSKVASMLLSGEVDVALLPVAVLAGLPEYYIVSKYCIGSTGEVASVCLFSEVPVEQLTEVVLDYQSRTSVALFKLLMQEYWKIEPRLLDAGDESYRTRIQGTTGAVVIGDRALEQRRLSTYIYDLSAAWNAMTGLPFVFAAWVSLRQLPEAWMQRFDAAQSVGLQQLSAIAEAGKYSPYDLFKYYTTNLSYELNAEKKKGMDLFLQKLKEQQSV
jgi:chorismate dehydratase